MNLLNSLELCTVFIQKQGKVFSLNSVLNFLVPNVGLHIRLCDGQNAEQQVKLMTFNGLPYQSSATPTRHSATTELNMWGCI
jgi:hypothetical protein